MEERGSGWILFSSVVLIVGGIMRMLDGLWALRSSRNDEAKLIDGLFGDTLKAYGWVWLLVGLVVVLAGVAVNQRSELGRWVGIVAAAILCITSVAWLPYYPVWSLVYIGIGFAVIYGLAAYGGNNDSLDTSPPTT